MLSIRQVLHCPLVLLGLLIFPCKLGIDNLLLSFCHDLVLLSFGQPLEVIWDEPMRSQLRLSGCLVLSHDIRHVSPMDLSLVHRLLIMFPCLVSLPLLLSQSFVELLHFLELLVLSHGAVVFHHASGSSDSFSLSSIVRLLFLAV